MLPARSSAKPARSSAGEPGEPRLQLGIGDIALGIVAPGLDEGDDLEPGAGGERGDLRARDRRGRGHAAADRTAPASSPRVVADGRIAAEPIGRRQLASRRLAVSTRWHPLARRSPAPAQHLLGVIDARAAERAIEHEADAAVGRQDAIERREPGRGIGQMMQHAAAVDVVEPARGPGSADRAASR